MAPYNCVCLCVYHMTLSSLKAKPVSSVHPPFLSMENHCALLQDIGSMNEWAVKERELMDKWSRWKEPTG